VHLDKQRNGKDRSACNKTERPKWLAAPEGNEKGRRGDKSTEEELTRREDYNPPEGTRHPSGSRISLKKDEKKKKNARELIVIARGEEQRSLRKKSSV